MLNWLKGSRRIAPLGTAVKQTQARTALMMQLEPRIMFDGAMAVTAADAVHAADAHAVTNPTHTTHEITTPDSSPAAATSVPTIDSDRHSVVFVDGRVNDAAQLLQGVAPGTEMVYLNQQQNGLQQIANYLEQHQGMSSVQIIAHGNDGDLWLGNSYLSADNVQASGAVLAEIGKDMQIGGDILIYGCYTAQGERGLSFVNSLAQLTGRDIAASDDRIGMGGDWDLEIATGNIESANVLSTTAMSEYEWGLATWTATNNANTGVGSLRAALASAQNGDIVTFNAGMTVSLTQVLVIDKNITVDGDLNNDSVADVTLDGQYRTQVISVSAGTTATLDGLIVTRGMAAGNGGNGGDDALVARGGGIDNAGTLTLRNVTVTANAASGGGGGGGVTPQYAGGGGGGGGAIAGGGTGGRGGDTLNSTGASGSAGQGGAGGGFFNIGGRGGSSTGGAGGAAYPGYSTGSAGGTAISGALSIGGGGGGDGYNDIGGAGGGAVGGIYNDTGATLVVIGNSVISNNVGAGGGGGGGGAGGEYTQAGGAGGVGVGAIWNRGSILMTAANFAAMAGNVGGSGTGGTSAGTAGVSPSAAANIYGNGGTLNSNYTPNDPPVISNVNGDSVAWAGVGATVVLDNGGNASLTDAELGALNGGNGDWSGGSLAVQRSGTAISADTLGFNTSGALFSVSGSNLQSGGLTFATFTNSGGVLTINFTSSGTAATTALVDDIAQRITYRSDTPAGDATLRFTLSDGTNSTTADVSVTSDTIYVTNTTDTATIDITNGVSFSEAIGIAAADATGNQTIAFAGSLASTALTINGVSLNEGLTFDMDAASGMSLTSGTITLGAATTQSFTLGTGDVASISGVIAGSGALTKTGAGDLTLSATNTYSGATTVSAGTLTVSGGDAIASNSSVTVASGATLALANNETIGNLSGAGAITLGSNTLTSIITADTTFSGGISGTGGLSVSQSGAATFALTLSGTNTYIGNTIAVNFGWLKLNGDASVSSSSQLRANGNSIITLQSDQTVGSLFSNNAGANIQLGGFTLSAGGDNTSTTVSGVVSGTGNLVKQGSGTLTLTGTNTYTGTTGVSAGTLSVASDSNLGSNSVTLAAGSTLDITGATTIDNAIALSGDATVSNSANATLSGVISGANNLTKTGASTLTLAGTNTYAGTTVSAGTLSVASDGNLGSGTVTLAGGTTLDVTGATTIDNAITLTGNAIVNNSANATLSGLISGANNLTKTGAATLTLSGTNTYAGTTVSAGTLSVASDGNLGSGAVTLAGGTTLSVTGATNIDNAVVLTGNATVSNSAIATLSGGISGSGNLAKSGASTLTLSGANAAHTGTTTVNAGTLNIGGDSNLGSGSVTLAGGTTLAVTAGGTIDNNLVLAGAATLQVGAATTWSGVISGSNNLAKTGASTLTLANTNTLSGTVTVSAGTLAVTGTASATTVASGATLTGTGTLDGTVTVQSGGTLSPGASPGTLTINGDLAMASGSTLAVEINGATAGTGYDQVIVNGTVDVSGASLSVTHGYVAGSGDVYNIIVNDAADAVTGTFSGLSEGATLPAGGNSTVLTASYIGGTGNDFILTAPANPVVTSVSSSTPDGTYKVGDTISVSVTFDMAVFVSGGTPTLLLETGTVDRELNYVSGSGSTTLVFDYIVQAGDLSADLDYASTGALVLNGGTIQDALNQNANLTLASPGAANSLGANKSLVVDGVLPTASIVVADTALAVGETSNVTITFSEAVTGLATGDFTVANGALTGLSTGDGGITWTATLTPTTSVTDTSNLVTLDNTGVQDAAGNTGTGTTDSNNYAIDTLRPLVSIALSDYALLAGETTTATFTFSEAVSGFSNADITVSNGTLSAVTSADGGITWTATFTPSTNTEDATNIIGVDNTGYVDAAGNAGTGTTGTINFTIDTLRPTATIAVADTALAAGESATVTITFSEAVTSFSNADFTVANGTLSAVSSADGGITWTATLTPMASIADTTNLLTLDNTGVQDAAGNAGIGTTDSNNYAIDTLRPTASIVVADTVLAIGETSTVTVNFNEAVTGLTTADFTVANGALSGLTSSDGGITWTATLTPSASISDTTNLVTLDNTGLTDAAGNTGTGTTDSNNYAVYTAQPTATIVVADTALAAGETSLVTITFSAPVTGFTNADLAIANGTLSTVSSSDGGTTWTATLTPTANITTTANVITLSNTGVLDVAGNTGAGTTDSNNYAIDTSIPAVTSVSVPDSGTYVAGQNLDFTVTLSEAVIVDSAGGVPRIAVTLDTGGTVYANYLSGSGSAELLFRLTLADGQLDANGVSLGGAIDTNGASVRDAAGNDASVQLNNVASTTSVLVDANAPTATDLILIDAPPANADTLHYRLSFSEDVNGVDVNDFVLVTTGNARADVASVTQVDARTYDIELNNVAGNGTLRIALNDSGTNIVDAAGNAIGGGLLGAPHTLASVAPSILVARSDNLPPAPPPFSSVITAPLSPSLPSIFDVQTDFAPEYSASNLAVPTIFTMEIGPTQRFNIPLPWRPEKFTHWTVVELRSSTGAAVPTWLHYDFTTGTLQGEPPVGFHGTLQIDLVETNSQGQRVIGTMHLHFDDVAQRSDVDTKPLAKRAATKAGLDAQFASHARSTPLDADAASLLRQLHFRTPDRPPTQSHAHY